MRKQHSAKPSSESNPNSEEGSQPSAPSGQKRAQNQKGSTDIGSPFLAKEQLGSGIDAAKVARARALLEDKEYPPKGVLHDIARHLANHWSEELSKPPLEPRRD